MKEPLIQCVCGCGCGSSLMLRMKVDDVLKKHNLTARTFCGDIMTCNATPCDVIFISAELADRVVGRAPFPAVIIERFTNPVEVETKTLEYFKSLEEQ